MSLAKNLQNLRGMRKMSQEELADKLDVSRQAVSKWESGESYPETEKIIAICDVFDCKMDDLVRGEISLDQKKLKNPLSSKNYNGIMTSVARNLSLGLMIILLGVSTTWMLTGLLLKNDQNTIISMIVMLGSVILAMPIFIINNTKVKEFRHQNPKLENIYSKEVIVREKAKYTKLFAMGVVIILLGVMTLLISINNETIRVNNNLQVAILMYFVTVGESLIFYSSKMLGKYNIEKYNQQNTKEYQDKINKAHKISSVMLIAAIIIFLVWGIITESWEMNWIVFLVWLLMCVIVNLLLGIGKRIR